MNKRNKNVLITGALGQDGVILSKILLQNNYKVHGWVKNKNYNNKLTNVNYSTISLLNKQKLISEIKKIKPSAIVHFGSSNPSYVERNNSEKYNAINTNSSINLINSIIESKIKCIFIFPNSSQIFSLKKIKKKIDENEKFYSINSYTDFRIKIFNYLKYLKNKNNFKFANLVLFNHDSIFRNKKFLIPKLINAFKMRDFKFINKIYRENIIGDFSHAEDICGAIAILIEKRVCIDNLILSSGKVTRVNDIIKYIYKINGFQKKFGKEIKRNNNLIIGNNLKAKKILKWRPKKDIYKVIDDYFI